MSTVLENKTALVVGASSGIGRATAMALAAEGMRVMVSARRGTLLEELERELCASGAEAASVVADVMNRTQAEAMVEATVRRFGSIDLIVYATGTNIPARAIDVLTADTWDMMVAVNLNGAFYTTAAALPHMRAAGGGLLVYISSISAHLADMVSGAAYQAAKRGLAGLAHATRLEEKANGIRTSVILPGLCATDLVYRRPAPTPPDVLAKALLPEDVAETVVAVARMHPRAVIPELEVVPSRL